MSPTNRNKTSMIKEKLKQAIFDSMKAKDDRLDILRVVLGSIQLEESRSGKDLSDEQVIKIMQKVIESNKIVGTAKTLRESDILMEMFPSQLKTWSKQNIYGFLEKNISVCEHKEQGKAIGLAMKLLKEAQIPANGKDVAEVVQELRNRHSGVVEC